MGAQFSVEIVLRAIDRATAPIAKVQAQINRSLKPMRDVVAQTKKLSDAAGLPKLSSAVGDAVNGVGDFIDKLDHAILKLGIFGGGVALAAYEISKAFGDKSEDILKTSKKLGLSTEQLQLWRYAASESGVEAQTFTQGLVQIQKTIGGANRGLVEPLQAIYQLGPAALDANGRVKKLGDLLPVIADKFESIRDPARRVDLAFRLFGRSGADLLPVFEGGSKGFAELSQEARELGIVLSDTALKHGAQVNKALGHIRKAVEGVKDSIADALSPEIVRASKEIVSWINDNKPLILELAGEFRDALPGALRVTVAALRIVISVLKFFGGLWNWFSNLIGPTPAAIAAISTVLLYTLVPSLAAAVGGLLVLSEVLVATPAGWVILAITAIVGALIGLVVAIGLVVHNWDSISGWFVSIWKRVSFAIANVVGFWKVVLGSAWDFIKSWALKIGGWVVDKIISAWSVLKGFFADLWAGIKDSFMSVFGWIVKVLLAPLEFVNSVVKSVSDTPKVAIAAGGDMAPAVSPQRLAAIAGGNRNQATATVKVDFANMPKGTRVLPKSADGVDLDLSLGYSMALP